MTFTQSPGFTLGVTLGVVHSTGLDKRIRTRTHHYTKDLNRRVGGSCAWERGAVTNDSEAPAGPATPSGTWRGPVLWGSWAELTWAAAGSGGSQQLASSRQGRKWSHHPTRVQQEALSMRPAFQAVESGVHFHLKTSNWISS